MSTVGYIVRDMTGTKQHGNFAEGTPSTIDTGLSKDISLNLAPSDVESYARRGQDLHITLANGESLVLDGYFNTSATGGKNLFLSQEGEFIEVVLEDRAEGMLFASYESLDLTGKWSAYDEMVFLDVDRIEPVVAPLIAAPFLGGGVAAGAAVVGGAAVLGGGGGGGGGSTDTTPPTVDITAGTQSTGHVVNADDHTNNPTITGTGEPGATVSLEINGTTRTTTVANDGSWSVSFDTSEISTGEYDTNITIVTTDASGNSTTTTDVLEVDTIAPTASTDTVEGDDVINAVEASDGVVLTGTGEAGASIEVTFQGETQTTTVASDGSWSASYAASTITAGTYDSTITVVSTDAAGNSSTSTHTVTVDTTTSISIDSLLAGDNVINAAEHSSGVTVTGTAEAGSTVVVTLGSVTHTVTTDASGNWSSTYSSAEIPTGTYTSTLTAVSTDLAGNTATTTGSVAVDTVAPTATVNTVEGNDVINAAEASNGVLLTGAGEPGASIDVTFQGVTQSTTVAANGSWSVNYAASSVAAGTYGSVVSVVTTDAAGNSSTTTHNVAVDTETSVTLDAAVAGDNIINGSERSSGVTLTGTAEAGSSVIVTLGAVSHTVTADASGNWSSAFSSAEIPSGDYNATISAVSTDLAGNTATATGNVAIDTSTFVSIDGNQAGGDNIVSLAEAQAGVTLTGVAEPGATVIVTVGGVNRTATVDASGNWSALFESGAIATGEYSTTVSVTSTDLAGNSRTSTAPLTVDTFVDNPEVTTVTFNGSGDVRRISTEGIGDTYTVHSLEAGGVVGVPAATQDPLLPSETEFTFGTAVSDGTHLVISGADAVGNSASTLLVLEDNATEVGSTDHTGLSQFNVDTVNLDYAENVNLTLTEADIRALSNNSDTVTIHGGTDDTVNVSGAVATGATQVHNGQVYDVYTIGSDGATLVIEDDINVII
ncbi:Ig-like domain-containing protein [Parasedimentitalea huanghaiensis]|uniref:Ig-like domain (Group 3) n=1 Tax=Parasedimentitalea huanghaiensis TaxID=2682100 RepID=A0A6L6WCG2_9RHOB|nr:Ig-like domain-containing protein [Zongyanglinia huanghaiensis]MVO14921.1 hypothetical protein [Zongyanglinia huanghaiensis]